MADWQKLLLLAHVNKSRAFTDYARFYMSTDGQIYWSDTHQLATYVDGYHATIDRHTGASVKGSEMISELYVRRSDLPAFMTTVRDDARLYDANIIYGTIRVIEKDDESVLAWAREPWACVVFNLHVDHSPSGLAKAERDFRRLIDRAADFGGSYYLTYHRWATRDQVERCHPRCASFSHARVPTILTERLRAIGTRPPSVVEPGSPWRTLMTPHFLLCAALALASPSVAPAADESPSAAAKQQITLYEVVLRDGSRLYGTISVKIRTRSCSRHRRGDRNDTPVGHPDIREVAGTLVHGEFMPPDPNSTRLFSRPPDDPCRAARPTWASTNF